MRYFLVSRSKELAINFPVSSYLNGTIFFIVSCFSFFSPFLLGHSQFLTGTIVNASLFSSAVFLPKKFIIPVIFLPGLGIISRGIVFGPFTPFLVYFLPFIWISNFLLIFTFRIIFRKGFYFSSILSSSFLKSFFLYLLAIIFFSFDIIPFTFISLMGINQFFTALFGGVIFLIIFGFLNNSKILNYLK